MTSIRRRAPILMLTLALATTALLTPPLRTAAAAAAETRRPNLQMVRLHEWHIQNVNGRRLLRFTTIFVNEGPGAFELRGARSSRQRQDDGDRPGPVPHQRQPFSPRHDAVAKYAGDGHDHWHVQGVVTYEAWALTTRRAPAAAQRPASASSTRPPGSSRSLRAPIGLLRAGVVRHASLHDESGRRVGRLGDRYPWDFVFQWIDITGLPGGTYRVRATVDIQDYYRETDELDNCVWTEVRIPAPGSGNAAHVLRNGRGCGDNAITPVTSFPRRHLQPADVAHLGRRPRRLDLQLGRHQAAQTVDGDLAGAHRHGHGARDAAGPGRARLFTACGPFAGYWVRQGRRRQLSLMHAAGPRLVGRDADDLVVAAVRGGQEEPATGPQTTARSRPQRPLNSVRPHAEPPRRSSKVKRRRSRLLERRHEQVPFHVSQAGVVHEVRRRSPASDPRSTTRAG